MSVVKLAARRAEELNARKSPCWICVEELRASGVKEVPVFDQCISQKYFSDNAD